MGGNLWFMGATVDAAIDAADIWPPPPLKSVPGTITTFPGRCCGQWVKSRKQVLLSYSQAPLQSSARPSRNPLGDASRVPEGVQSIMEIIVNGHRPGARLQAPPGLQSRRASGRQGCYVFQPEIMVVGSANPSSISGSRCRRALLSLMRVEARVKTSDSNNASLRFTPPGSYPPFRSASMHFWAIALVDRSLLWGFTADDSFIVYRYAENLGAGNGLTYNPGEFDLGTHITRCMRSSVPC